MQPTSDRIDFEAVLAAVLSKLRQWPGTVSCLYSPSQYWGGKHHCHLLLQIRSLCAEETCPCLLSCCECPGFGHGQSVPRVHCQLLCPCTLRSRHFKQLFYSSKDNKEKPSSHVETTAEKGAKTEKERSSSISKPVWRVVCKASGRELCNSQRSRSRGIPQEKDSVDEPTSRKKPSLVTWWAFGSIW